MGTCCTSNSSSTVVAQAKELNYTASNTNIIHPLTKTTYNTIIELILMNRILIHSKNEDSYRQYLSVEERDLLRVISYNGFFKYLDKHYLGIFKKSVGQLLGAVFCYYQQQILTFVLYLNYDLTPIIDLLCFINIGYLDI